MRPSHPSVVHALRHLHRRGGPLDALVRAAGPRAGARGRRAASRRRRSLRPRDAGVPRRGLRASGPLVRDRERARARRRCPRTGNPRARASTQQLEGWDARRPSPLRVRRGPRAALSRAPQDRRVQRVPRRHRVRRLHEPRESTASARSTGPSSSRPTSRTRSSASSTRGARNKRCAVAQASRPTSS